MKKKPAYWSIDDVVARHPNTMVYIVVGRRGAGKSYSIKKRCIRRYLKDDLKFVYVRVYAADLKTGSALTIFDDVSADPDVQKWLKDKYCTDEEEYTNMYIQIKGENICVFGRNSYNKNIKIDQIGVVTALSTSTRFKGGTYLGYESIFFDEFIDYYTGDKYVDYFNKIIYTVARTTNDIKIFMAGNPDYNIELCPFLQDLNLDYAKMEANTEYLFSTIDAKGELQEDNKIFIKLASADATDLGDFLDVKTYGIWGQTKSLMSYTGEVDIKHFIHFTDEQLERFNPMYYIEAETPVVRNVDYHLNIHLYIGLLDNTPFIFASLHKLNYELPCIYSRYDSEKWVDRIEPVVYRLNLTSEFSDVKKLLSDCLILKTIANKDDVAGQWLLDIISAQNN